MSVKYKIKKIKIKYRIKYVLPNLGSKGTTLLSRYKMILYLTQDNNMLQYKMKIDERYK